MKKTITLLLAVFSVLALSAQDELIKNGDFSQGVSGSEKIKDLAYWAMDMETPSSGWWSLHAGLTSTDTTLYQVVEVISSDSVVYTLTFDCADSWISDKIIAIASVCEADSTVRTRIDTAQFSFNQEFKFTFGFSQDSPYTGKRLVIEFDLTSKEAGAAWANLDNVSMKKVIAGVNSAPVAVVGPAQTVKGTSEVTLDGSGSNDFENSTLTYTWTSVYPGISLSDRHAVNPTFTAPDVTELTTFEFTLIVNDGELNSEIAIATVTVFPAGELIRNGSFEQLIDGAEPASTELKDLLAWNIDEPADSLGGGIAGNTGSKFVYLASIDSVLYQVIKPVGTAEATYTLSFSARSSWDASGIKSIFSVCDADSTVRTVIDSKTAVFEINVPNGTHTTTMKTYIHILVIPANSAYVGKNLVVEFDNLPYDEVTDGGWAELDNISLIESVSSTSVANIRSSASLSIYPNPATDVLNITSSSRISKVEVYSVLGNLEKTWSNSDIRQVEVNELSKGLHFLKVSTESGIITKKFQVK